MVAIALTFASAANAQTSNDEHRNIKPLNSAQAAMPTSSLGLATADQLISDLDAAASMATKGQLLYDADANKKSWGQYCASSQRLSDAGEFRKAIHEAAKALYLGRRNSNRGALAYAMRDLAYAYSFAGDLGKAEEWARQAIPAARAIPNPKVDVENEIVAPAAKVLGDVSFRRGNINDALEHYKAALKAASFFSVQTDEIRIAMAIAEMKRGAFSPARELLEKATSSSKAAIAAVGRRAFGDLLLFEGNSAEALKQFESAIAGAQSAKDMEGELWGHYGAARAKRAAGNLPAAMEALDKSVALAESLRGRFRVEEFKTGYFSGVQEIFDTAIEIAAELGDAQRALDFSEKSRARAALDQIRDRTRLAQGGKHLAKFSAANAKELQATLPDNLTILAYHVTAARTYIWSIRRNEIKLRSSPIGMNALENHIVRWREGIADQLETQEATERELYQVLIGNLQLRPDETLVIVPHKALHLAPLHALHDGRKRLIETVPVAYALSLTAIAETLSRPLASTPGLLAMGNPDLGNPALDLPAAEEEVTAIRKLLGGGDVFVRQEATPERFRSLATNKAVVHIAAHGVVDEIDPLYSSIKLYSGDIEAHEIYRLDLRNANLIALSACSSGLGKVSGGDEFWGFKRSFLVAGAKTLMVSLWPVSDVATSRLMQSFYRHYPSAGSAKALQLAQLEMLGTEFGRKTLLWSPFVLVGDWR